MVFKPTALLTFVMLLNAAATGQSTDASFEANLPLAMRVIPPFGQPVRILSFPIAPDKNVELELRRFAVTGPNTRFVARSGGVDRPFEYDASRVVLFEGTVVGHAGSSVFIARAPSMGFVGRIDDGAGHIASIGSVQTESGPSPDRLRVIPGPVGARTGAAPLCGVDSSEWTEPELLEDNFPADFLVEVAVDTDFDFYEMFDDVNRALDYVQILYGQASFVFSRDSGIRLTLSFTRIWTDPDDLFNGSGPLGEFRDYWNENMQDVHRDVTQLCSGRRDYAFGGQAWLNQVCSNSAYSVCGYMGAGLGEPDLPSHMNGDLVVAAHELGHNFGSPHTHSRGLDTCDDAFAQPRRGPIMSYCGQSYSGGDANHDARFHTDSTRLMRAYLASVPDCLDVDCNANSIADATDIANGTSADVNANGVPDECEDCNDNGVFDDEDIASGFSLDLNANGIPDECEPDCNENGVPDDLDIALGDALDEDGNGVPDSCQADCDGNGIADSLDINADMSLDRDRNLVLDDCQDCDGDGVNDLLALEHEHNIWIGSLLPDPGVREFYGATGVLMQSASNTGIETTNDLVITPDKRILVASAADDRIVELAPDGSVVGDLVASGAGGLDEPAGMVLTEGTLLVSSRQTAQVLEYDLETGVFLRTLAELPASPFGLAHAPDDGLLVALADNSVLELDIATGDLRRVVVDANNNGGLADPRGLVIDTLDRLLVCSFATNEVLAYRLASGAPLGKFNRNGTENRLFLEEPWSIRIGPNRNVFVSNSSIHQDRRPPEDLHLTQARVYEFDYHFGNFLRAQIQGADTELWRPSGFDFVPGGDIDCNLNFFPDACEIAMGLVEDLNGDGIPDECQICVADLNGDGDIDAEDFFVYLDLFTAGDPAADLTGSSDPTKRSYAVPDGDIDSDDFFVFLDFFVAGC